MPVVVLVTPPSILLLAEPAFSTLGIQNIAGPLERDGISAEHFELSDTENYIESHSTGQGAPAARPGFILRRSAPFADAAQL